MGLLSRNLHADLGNVDQFDLMLVIFLVRDVLRPGKVADLVGIDNALRSVDSGDYSTDGLAQSGIFDDNLFYYRARSRRRQRRQRVRI